MRWLKGDPSGVAWRVTLVYVVAATAWILLSDTLLEALFAETQPLMVYSRFKGLVFVMVTGTILFCVLSALVSRLIESQRSVAQSERRLSAIVEALPDGVALIDAAGTIVQVTDRAAALVGRSPRDLLGRDVREFPILGFDGDGQRHADWFDHVLERRAGAVGRRVRLDLPGTDELVVEVDVVPVLAEDGSVSAVVLTIEDVAQEAADDDARRRHADGLEALVAARTGELEAANAELSAARLARSEFVANMSHELRTPLNSVIGFSGVLDRGMAGPLDEEQRYMISLINRSGKLLLSLVDAMLDLVHIDTGRVFIEPSEFDAAVLVTDVARSLGPSATERGLTVDISVPEEPCPMRSDRAKVQQILLHLGDNAVKFTEKGHVSLGLTCDDGTFAFSVSDTGPGIADSDLEIVFDEFRQAVRMRGVKPQGVGLGLAISKKIAAMLGGDIEVETRVGEGTRFTFRVPDVYHERAGHDAGPEGPRG